jgi:hypothetical protein
MLIIVEKKMISLTILSENTVRGAGLTGARTLPSWHDTGIQPCIRNMFAFTTCENALVLNK